MTVEIYGDLLFLINMGMDALCLGLTGRILNQRLPRGRFWLASVLGGIYAVVALFLDVGQALALAADGAVCLGMCWLVFGGRGPGGVLGATGLYFFLSMALGGIMTALYQGLNRLGLDQWLPDGEEGMGVWLFTLLALLATALSLWGGKRFKHSSMLQICAVELWLSDVSVTVEGMVDTGNLLREPISGRPVLCTEAKWLAPLLPNEWKEIMQNGITDQTDSLDHLRGLRLIPTSTADGEALLIGFLPDRVCLRWQKQGKSYSKEVDAVVACVRHLHGTQALIPIDLLT
ncbi:MAG: sigma-E processing peptidase SpoIIGA [Clostridia bacterium]|nr:sigma-E processing peptidase SpoIIGA [Clostridia bacterium]